MVRNSRLVIVLGLLALLATYCAAPTAPPATQVPTAVPTQAPAATVPPAPTKAATVPSAPTTAPTVPTAKKEIVVRMAVVDPCGEKNSLDPLNQPDGECQVMINQVYNRLLDMDSNFQVRPELAESFEPNKDATEWTFHLRKGVKFHDGHELNAKDVVWTFNRLIDPALKSEAAPSLAFLKSNSVVAVDNYTVKFVLDKPVPELPVLITIKNTWIVPDGATEKTLRLNGVGTGPFIPVKFEPVQQPHVFVKNPNYWEAGLPKADRMEFYLIPEATTRNAAIQSGQVDIVQNVDFATLAALQKDANLKILSTGPSTSLVLAMMVDTPPYNDNRVRQALKKVVDRQAMLSTVLLGYGTIGDDSPIPPVSPYAWRKDVPARDVEGAKKLLAEAGYGPAKPLALDLYTAEVLPGALALAQLFREQAAQAGIKVNVIVSPPKEYWDTAWLKQPFVVSGWVQRYPAEALAIAYRSNAKYNETHWVRPDFDKILDEANTTVDSQQRLGLYKKAEKLLTEEGGALIPMFMYTTAAMRTNCSGYTPHVQSSRVDTRSVTCTR